MWELGDYAISLKCLAAYRRVREVTFHHSNSASWLLYGEWVQRQKARIPYKCRCQAPRSQGDPVHWKDITEEGSAIWKGGGG